MLSNPSGRNIWIGATFVTSIDDNVKVESRKMMLAFVNAGRGEEGGREERAERRYKMEIGRKANYSATAAATVDSSLSSLFERYTATVMDRPQQ